MIVSKELLKLFKDLSQTWILEEKMTHQIFHIIKYFDQMKLFLKE